MRRSGGGGDDAGLVVAVVELAVGGVEDGTGFGRIIGV